jgi:hypothetical protein
VPLSTELRLGVKIKMPFAMSGNSIPPAVNRVSDAHEFDFRLSEAHFPDWESNYHR